MSVLPTAPTAGSAVTLTATVTSLVGGQPTGTVTFFDGSTNLGTQTLPGYVVTLTVSNFAAGVHSLTATYNGDSAHGAGNSNTVSLTVGAATTTSSVYFVSNGLSGTSNSSLLTFAANSTGTAAMPTATLNAPSGVTFLSVALDSAGNEHILSAYCG